MELIVQFLMLLVCLVASVKLSHAPKWASWVYALVVGIFIFMTSDLASSQTRAGIGGYIEHRELREYIAILVTLESMLFVLFTFISFRRDQGKERRCPMLRRWMQEILTFYPPLLVFPALFYAQTNLIFAMPGVDFERLSIVFAMAMALFFVLMPSLMRYLLPEREMRLEILFLSSLFIFVLGLITTVDDKMTYAAPEYELPWRGLALALGLFAICFVLGMLMPPLKRLITKR
ncbi:MAG: hypothetical protein Q4A64_03935 [Porphyromonadaceae bacterium]|nr:hypothetical protein [Porphyromonadaceae bacterium]